MPKVQPKGENFPKVQLKGENVPKVQPKGENLPKVQPKGENLPKVQPKGENLPKVKLKGENLPKFQPKGENLPELQPKGGENLPEVQPKGENLPHFIKKQRCDQYWCSACLSLLVTYETLLVHLQGRNHSNNVSRPYTKLNNVSASTETCNTRASDINSLEYQTNSLTITSTRELLTEVLTELEEVTIFLELIEKGALLNCDLCKVIVYGDVSIQSHFTDEIHNSFVKQALRMQSSESAKRVESLVELTAIEKCKLTCKQCAVEEFGYKQIWKHVTGTVHTKNVHALNRRAEYLAKEILFHNEPETIETQPSSNSSLPRPEIGPLIDLTKLSIYLSKQVSSSDTIISSIRKPDNVENESSVEEVSKSFSVDSVLDSGCVESISEIKEDVDQTIDRKCLTNGPIYSSINLLKPKDKINETATIHKFLDRAHAPLYDSTSRLTQPSLNSSISEVTQLSLNSSTSEVLQLSLNSSTSGVTQPSLNSSISGVTQPSLNSSTSGVTQPCLNSSTSGVTQPSINSSSSEVTQPSLNSSTSGVTQPSLNSSASGVTQPSLNSSTSGVTQPSLNSWQHSSSSALNTESSQVSLCKYC